METHSLTVHMADHPQDVAASCVEGEQLHAAMMTCWKRRPSLSEDWMEEANGSELVDTSAHTTGSRAASHVSKRQRSGTFHHRHHSTQLDEMLVVAQDQRADDQEYCKEEREQWKVQCRYEEHMMAVSTRACDIQERTSIALLDILRQSLLAPYQ